MKKNYFKALPLLLILFFAACGSDEGPQSDDGEYEMVSPVVVDLSTVPYPKLSDYKFFEGEMKNLEPAYKVLPYDLNSPLFTDYAHKKRFVWMPEGVKATYDADNHILNFPTGAVLIKSFYYENIQPNNTTRIIETRLMIKKETGWIFANYIWNDEQTEAYYDMAGGFTQVSWLENGVPKSTNYIIPPAADCLTCHKNNDNPWPIGPKPQNLNKNYMYADGMQNQLSRWIEEGYLAEGGVPQEIITTVDWTDTSQPLELRVRSYIDINCAHCHSTGAHCDYMSMRFAFSETGIPANLGICIPPVQSNYPSVTYIVAKKSPPRSALYYRINTTDQNARMPIVGRTLIHEEGVALIKQWINGMDTPCP